MDIDKTLEEVKQTVRREKARDLKPIPSDFYSTAAAAVKNLEAEMMKNGRPRSVEYKMLEDELSGLVTDVETVFMKRAGKVVERATSGAFTNSKNILLKKDVDKLLPAEQELYEDVLRAILKARSALIAELVDADKEDSSKPIFKTEQKGQMPIQKTESKVELRSEPKNEQKADPKAEEAAAKTVPNAAESAAHARGQAPSSSANVINENYILVRILKDLPEFMGEDKRTYQLKAQDEVKLPTANANLLIKRGVALGITGSSEGNPES
jgi:DNA replication factor GINS